MESGAQGTQEKVVLLIFLNFIVNVLCLPFCCFEINYRTGEPLWAETARLVSKVILMFLFIAFFVFVIMQVLDSPKATFIVTEIADNGQVTTPGMYCIYGYIVNI